MEKWSAGWGTLALYFPLIIVADPFRFSSLRRHYGIFLDLQPLEPLELLCSLLRTSFLLLLPLYTVASHGGTQTHATNEVGVVLLLLFSSKRHFFAGH